MSKEWKKAKKISIILLEKANKLLLNLLSLKLWEREELKFSTWLTLLMNIWSNNWRNTIPRSSSLAQRKDLTWMRLRKRRSSKKKRKPNLNNCASWWKMFWETKLRKLLFPTELMSHLVYWLLENMDGLLTWRESWRHKPSETHLWLPTWCPRRPWKSTQRTTLLLNWERRLRLTRETRLSKIWSGFCLRLPSWPLVSP